MIVYQGFFKTTTFLLFSNRGWNMCRMTLALDLAFLTFFRGIVNYKRPQNGLLHVEGVVAVIVY